MNPEKLLNVKAKSVSIEITTCCALNCVYCERKIKKQTMSYEQFLQMKKIIKKNKMIERVTFCGIGEAFLHKDFYKMIAELKDYKITIITSGTVLIDFEELGKYENIDIIIFSIDSPSKEEVIDICGENYNYANLEENMKHLKQYVKDCFKKHRMITTVVNCTVNDKNMNRLEAMVDFTFAHKFSSIHFSMPWGNYELIEKNYDAVEKEVIRAKKKADRYGIYMESPFNSFCCVTNDHIMPYIDVNGNYYPCAYALYEKEAAGNVFEEDYEALQTSKNAYRLYDADFCKRCFLYQFKRLGVEKGEHKRGVH